MCSSDLLALSECTKTSSKSCVSFPEYLFKLCALANMKDSIPVGRELREGGGDVGAVKFSRKSVCTCSL